MISSRKSSSSKGFIVGLTMTEVILLLAFLFLINLYLSALKLSSYQEEISKLKAYHDEYQKYRKQVQDTLNKMGVTLEQLPDCWSRLVPLESIEEDKQKLITHLNKYKEERKKLLEEIRLLRSQLTLFQISQTKDSETERTGKGGIDERPCWKDATGKLEFLFFIIMYDDGFLIKKAWTGKKSHDPIVEILPSDIFGVKISNERFIELCDPIFDRCRKNKCRHFVYVCDRTNTKNIYKAQLEIIENYFYKLLKD